LEQEAFARKRFNYTELGGLVGMREMAAPFAFTE
jgi:hypothetical protein